MMNFPSDERTAMRRSGVPVPSDAFKSSLQVRLRAVHAERTLRKGSAFLFILFSVPTIAIAVLAIFAGQLLAPAFSPDRFLQRAEAAAIGYQPGRIYYTKVREIPGKDATQYEWSDPEPVTKEDWFMEDEQFLRWRTRWAHDDGTSTVGSLIFFRSPDHVFSDARFVLPPADGKIAVCVRPAVFVHDPFLAENPFVAPSEARYELDRQWALLMELEDKDRSRRIAALRQLLEKGNAVYEGEVVVADRTLHSFRVTQYTLQADEQDTVVLEESPRFLRMQFDGAHALIRREDWEIIDGKESQQLMTEYLDQRIVDEPVAAVFDPEPQGLVDLWSFIPDSKESFRTLKEGEQACFYQGKRYASSDPFLEEVGFLNIYPLDVEINPR